MKVKIERDFVAFAEQYKAGRNVEMTPEQIDLLSKTAPGFITVEEKKKGKGKEDGEVEVDNQKDVTGTQA